jgi:hypothetical protein
MHVRRFKRRGIGEPLEVSVAVAQQSVGAILDPVGNIRIGRAAFGRVVLKTAIGGRVVRRRDNNAVGEAVFSAPVLDQNGA